MTVFLWPRVFIIILFLLNYSRLKKYCMSQLSKNIFVLHVDRVLLELFQFTHGTFFRTPCSAEWNFLLFQYPLAEKSTQSR